jgi:putative Mg2+ transporter-C (MgtC) family protein
MVTGVGFICAGVIMQEGVHLVGLTTAATIWIVAAIGMGIGGGEYFLVFLATAVVLAVLWAFPMVEDRIYKVRDKRTYEITSDIDHATLGHLRDSIHQCGLRAEEPKLVKSKDELISIWEVYGSPDQHDTLVNQLVIQPEVKSLDY